MRPPNHTCYLKILSMKIKTIDKTSEKVSRLRTSFWVVVLSGGLKLQLPTKRHLEEQSLEPNSYDP